MHAVNMSPSENFDPNQFNQLNDVHNHITKGILQARVNNELSLNDQNRSLQGDIPLRPLLFDGSSNNQTGRVYNANE